MLLKSCVLYCFHSYLQKLLEEIEKNKDQIENCQKDAKAYIDSVKVSAEIFTFKTEANVLL